MELFYVIIDICAQVGQSLGEWRVGIVLVLKCGGQFQIVDIIEISNLLRQEHQIVMLLPTIVLYLLDAE